MIKESVIKILSANKIENLKLLTPKNPDHGDYAFHVKSAGKEIDVKKLHSDLFSNVDRVGNFINLTISPIALLEELTTISEQKDRYGSIKQDKPKKINIEYGQPNTHKLPHIGHLFSYIYGESLARFLQSQGNTVFRANYQGDVGLHVAKCLYRVRSHESRVTKLKTLEEKVQFMQQCYQEGAKAYEDNESAKKEIDELNRKIYQNDLSIVDMWRQTRQWSLDYYSAFEKKLAISYNKHYFESETGPVGKKTVEKHIGTVFEKSDGAIIFRGEPHGLHTRVFINKYGNPTYEAKDVGLIQLKKNDWPFDKAILTTASEQNAYYQVVKKAIELIFPDLKDKIFHIGFGMIDLKEGKMSSRSGRILSAMDLVDDVVLSVDMLVDKTKRTKHEIEKINETVALAAIKYSFLKSEARKNISFNIKESVSTTGNSGPYLMYTYARCRSVLNKIALSVIPSSREESHTPVSEIPRLPTHRRDPRDDLEKEELALLRSFFRFPEVVAEAAKNYSPHLLCTYLFDLAQKFSVFYENCPILKADNNTQEVRLALTQATGQILKNGLNLLGIEVLETI